MSTDSRDRIPGCFRTLRFIHASQFVRIWELTGGVCWEPRASAGPGNTDMLNVLFRNETWPLAQRRKRCWMQSGELDRDEMETEEQRRSLSPADVHQLCRLEPVRRRRVTSPSLPGCAITDLTFAGVSLFPSSAASSQSSPPACKQPNMSLCKWVCERLWLTTASEVPTVGTKMPTNSSPWRQKWCWALRRGNCGSPHRRAAKVLMRM